jgi:predicted amidohydrolase YtcJ
MGMRSGDLYVDGVHIGSLLGAGVPVGGSTDAPFGDPNPWLAIRAAMGRRTAGGAVVGPHERVSGPRALGLFLGRSTRPGGPPRTVAVGHDADLVLLDGPLDDVLANPDPKRVIATIRAVRVIFGGDSSTGS